MAAPVIKCTRAPRTRITTPGGRTLAVAESLFGLQVAEEAGPAIHVVVGASDMRLADKRVGQTGGLSAPSAIKQWRNMQTSTGLRCNSTRGCIDAGTVTI